MFDIGLNDGHLWVFKRLVSIRITQAHRCLYSALLLDYQPLRGAFGSQISRPDLKWPNSVITSRATVYTFFGPEHWAQSFMAHWSYLSTLDSNLRLYTIPLCLVLISLKPAFFMERATHWYFFQIITRFSLEKFLTRKSYVFESCSHNLPNHGVAL